MEYKIITTETLGKPTAAQTINFSKKGFVRLSKSATALIRGEQPSSHVLFLQDTEDERCWYLVPGKKGFELKLHKGSFYFYSKALIEKVQLLAENEGSVICHLQSKASINQFPSAHLFIIPMSK